LKKKGFLLKAFFLFIRKSKASHNAYSGRLMN
jgi:hypothetical protein